MSEDKTNPLSQGYRVFVDDNYHFSNEDERYRLGDFATHEEALQAAKKIVEEFFKKEMIGRPAAEILKDYKGFGEDSWIQTFGGAPSSKVHFSAWDYAAELSEKVSQGTFVPNK